MTTIVKGRIAGQPFALDADQVRQAVAGVLPEPLHEHYVVIDGRRFPPKQVIAAVTGLDRADFTTHQARRTLRRLGFLTGRRATPPPPPPPSRTDKSTWPHQGREAEALRPYMGKWVAQKGIEVIFAADTFGEILDWLERNDQYADGTFRVPEPDALAEGWTSKVAITRWP